MNEEKKDVELKVEQTAEKAKSPDLRVEDLDKVVGGLRARIVVDPKSEIRQR